MEGRVATSASNIYDKTNMGSQVIIHIVRIFSFELLCIAHALLIACCVRNCDVQVCTLYH